MTPDPEAWKTRILEQNELAKTAAGNATDAASHTAVETIAALPKDSRDTAADVFISASGFVGTLMSQLADQMQAVIN